MEIPNVSVAESACRRARLADGLSTLVGLARKIGLVLALAGYLGVAIESAASYAIAALDEIPAAGHQALTLDTEVRQEIVRYRLAVKNAIKRLQSRPVVTARPLIADNLAVGLHLPVDSGGRSKG